MSSIASTLAGLIRERVTVDAQDASAEIRLIFHGPPLEILDDVFAALEAGVAEGRVPVVLQVPSLAPGEPNPPIGQSGRCNETHLLNLRNSPAEPNYVALVPPGRHAIKSIATTSGDFGVAVANNAGNAPFENWWGDAFVQELVGRAIRGMGFGEDEEEAARSIVQNAAEAADSVEAMREARIGAWRVIARLHAAANGPASLTPASRLALACGVPPMAGGAFDAKAQLSTLDKLADALSEGFSTGISKAIETAGGADAGNLAKFLAHLEGVCELPTSFERSPAAYYVPTTGRDLPDPPLWWTFLTVEKWAEYLAEESAQAGDIVMSCLNALMPASKGMPILVEDEVELGFTTVGGTGSEVLVTIERTPGGPEGKQIGEITPDTGQSFVDDAPPVHRAPMRYVASADGFKPGTLKVVSMATWGPGLYVACRGARKLSPPKRRKGKRGPEYEAGLIVSGAGRYELLLLASPGVTINDTAMGSTDDAAERGDVAHQLAVRAGAHFKHLEIETDGNYQVDIGFEREGSDGKKTTETCRVFLTVEEVAQQGCRSEFERLIRANRRVLQPADAKPVINPNRYARSTTLQEWIISSEAAARSYLPSVLGEDYVDAWAQPSWSERGPIFSTGQFLKDPRPSPEEFIPPEGFVESRELIASRIRGGGDETGVIEMAQLGRWLVDDAEFRAAVELYLSAYNTWLANDPDVACWVDAIVVASFEHDGHTISRTPDAILLSPLHPLRIAWHCVAQQVLRESELTERPCPAASVFDPDCVPDILSLALRSPAGIDHVDFVAVENGTDYWSVLWNGSKLKGLPERSRRAPFGEAFGVTVGGISAGFSAAQVGRALEDVSDLLAAKPAIGVAVASAGGATDACNEGLISWTSDRFGESDRKPPVLAAGSRVVEIFDDRAATARPDDATIANLSEDTNNCVRWFVGQPQGVVPDLGIIAQLDMSEPETIPVANRTPIGLGGLIRHRVRRQLPGHFLSESRQALPGPKTGDDLADDVAAVLARMENLGQARIGLSFAPNVNAVRNMLTVRKTDFVAVSSSAIDPACFLGGWLEGTYLWDYDLPSYSHRAGDTNGYYLLSQVKEADREALAKALGRLPGCEAMPPGDVEEVLLEVARRGIPTIRGLAGDDSGATGDLGLFLAVRLLQDRFRKSGDFESLLPVVSDKEEDDVLAIVVPVDPFRGYLSDLSRSLGRDRKDGGQSRPDLLVIGMRCNASGVQLHLTPVEVKCRPKSTFPASEVSDALDQAKNLSGLLGDMLPRKEQPRAWALAFQHLLLSIVGFGMRVYSQHPDVVDQDRWSRLHEQVAASILSAEASITVDERGRLIVIDESPRSAPRDRDGDGFDETITITTEDATTIVSGDPAAFYASVRERVGNWQLLPGQQVHRQMPETASSESLPIEVAEEQAALEPEVVQPPSPDAGGAPPVDSGEQLVADAKGIVLNVGSTVDGFQPRKLTLNISDTRLSHMNMGVVGDLGTGKTQFLKSLITQVSAAAQENRGIKPRFLILDYKRDYSSPDFVEATGARVVKPHNLPLNLFDTSSMEDANAPWLQRFFFFRDVLDKIYSGIGPVQGERLKRAVKAAYAAAAPGEAPTLDAVHAEYETIVDGKPDSVSSIMSDLVDMGVFASDQRKIQPFSEFLDGVVVLSLDALGQDDRNKNMVVAIMLNLFFENMLKTPKREFLGSDPQLRAIDSFLLVDEADNIMQYEFDVLKKLLLQGREFGTGIILASQYLKHFKVNATDYRDPLLTWFVHKVPNVTPAELAALGLTGQLSELADRVKALKNHQCLFKSFNALGGEVIRGLPFFELKDAQD